MDWSPTLHYPILPHTDNRVTFTLRDEQWWQIAYFYCAFNFTLYFYQHQRYRANLNISVRTNVRSRSTSNVARCEYNPVRDVPCHSGPRRKHASRQLPHLQTTVTLTAETNQEFRYHRQ